MYYLNFKILFIARIMSNGHSTVIINYLRHDTKKIFGLMLLANKYNKNKIGFITLKVSIILPSTLNNSKSKVDKITFGLYIFSSRTTIFFNEFEL